MTWKMYVCMYMSIAMNINYLLLFVLLQQTLHTQSFYTKERQSGFWRRVCEVERHQWWCPEKGGVWWERDGGGGSGTSWWKESSFRLVSWVFAEHWIGLGDFSRWWCSCLQELVLLEGWMLSSGVRFCVGCFLRRSMAESDKWCRHFQQLREDILVQVYFVVPGRIFVLASSLNMYKASVV